MRHRASNSSGHCDSPTLPIATNKVGCGTGSPIQHPSTAQHPSHPIPFSPSTPPPPQHPFLPGHPSSAQHPFPQAPLRLQHPPHPIPLSQYLSQALNEGSSPYSRILPEAGSPLLHPWTWIQALNFGPGKALAQVTEPGGVLRPELFPSSPLCHPVWKFPCS